MNTSSFQDILLRYIPPAEEVLLDFLVEKKNCSRFEGQLLLMVRRECMVRGSVFMSRKSPIICALKERALKLGLIQTEEIPPAHVYSFGSSKEVAVPVKTIIEAG